MESPELKEMFTKYMSVCLHVVPERKLPDFSTKFANKRIKSIKNELEGSHKHVLKLVSKNFY